jgi:hypothetical protein
MNRALMLTGDLNQRKRRCSGLAIIGWMMLTRTIFKSETLRTLQLFRAAMGTSVGDHARK